MTYTNNLAYKSLKFSTQTFWAVISISNLSHRKVVNGSKLLTQKSKSHFDSWIEVLKLEFFPCFAKV